MTDFETIKKGEETLLALTEPITDKKYALMMLCRTPMAWAYLTPELKADPDVMMCYQPIGYMEQEMGVYAGVKDILGEDIYLEEGFEYFKPENGIGRYFVPSWAKNIQGFDYERYFLTQYAMLGSRTYLTDPDLYGSNEAQAKFAEAKSHFTNLASEYPFKDRDTYYGEFCIKIFDRSGLRKRFGVEDPEFDAMQR